MECQQDDEFNINNIVHICGMDFEYIKRKGAINSQKRSMGTGKYGYSLTYIQKNPQFFQTKECTEILRPETPYVIYTETECENYIRAVKNMNNSFEKVKNYKNLDKYVKEIAEQFIIDIEEEFDLDTVYQSLHKFVQVYKSGEKLIPQPINFILRSEGFDAVISSDELCCASYLEGNILLV